MNVTFSLTNSLQGMGQSFSYLQYMVNCSEEETKGKLGVLSTAGCRVIALTVHFL